MDGDKFAISMQAKIDEAFEDLDMTCRRCQYLNEYASCKLREPDDTEGECPLVNISCKSCFYCCTIVDSCGEELADTFYCRLNNELLDEDASACREYIKENE